MGLPILDILCRVLPGDTERAKADLARAVLSALRDHDVDPDVLTARLERCDTERQSERTRGDHFASAHETMTFQLADARDALAGETARADLHEGSTRLLAAFLDGTFNVDAARAQVEACGGTPDATQG